MLLVKRISAKGASSGTKALLPLQGEKHSPRNELSTSLKLDKQILQLKKVENDIEITSIQSNIPSNSRVVICGGGLMGCSVAYHLALEGFGKHTVLIEKGQIGGGRSGSSGLVGAYKPSFAQTKLAQQSIALLEKLDKENLETGWRRCGSLNVARSSDRMHQFRRMKSQSV